MLVVALAFNPATDDTSFFFFLPSKRLYSCKTCKSVDNDYDESFVLQRTNLAIIVLVLAVCCLVLIELLPILVQQVAHCHLILLVYLAPVLWKPAGFKWQDTLGAQSGWIVGAKAEWPPGWWVVVCFLRKTNGQSQSRAMTAQNSKMMTRCVACEKWSFLLDNWEEVEWRKKWRITQAGANKLASLARWMNTSWLPSQIEPKGLLFVLSRKMTARSICQAMTFQSLHLPQFFKKNKAEVSNFNISPFKKKVCRKHGGS